MNLYPRPLDLFFFCTHDKINDKINLWTLSSCARKYVKNIPAPIAQIFFLIRIENINTIVPVVMLDTSPRKSTVNSLKIQLIFVSGQKPPKCTVKTITVPIMYIVEMIKWKRRKTTIFDAMIVLRNFPEIIDIPNCNTSTK